MIDKLMCPRRVEVMNATSRYPNEDYWRDNSTCSFCGSMHPEVVLSAMQSGAEIGPTDKNYKVYVKIVDLEGKFYFQHFDEAQQVRFIELYNTKPRPFVIGYPGDFYVLPFFVRKAVNS